MKYLTHPTFFRFLFSLIGIVVLVVFNPTQNASKSLSDVSLDSLSPEEEYTLNHFYYAEKAQQVDSFLNLAQHVYGYNGNALVSLQGQVVLKESYGKIIPGGKETLPGDAAFQLASISKQFTAVGILLLVQDGSLSLDQDLSDFIPEVPYPDITIQQLLHHTSGLPNYMYLLEHHWKEERLPNNEELIQLLAQHPYPHYFRPGRRHDYSNTGYALLASVIERVSKQSYARFMHERIFLPLGMKNAFVLTIWDEANQADRIKGYYKRWRRWAEYQPTVHDGIVGDKGIYASVYDLYLWDRGLEEGRLLHQDLLAEAYTPGLIRERYPFPYGYGFRIRYANDQKIVYHNGRWEGFRNSFHRCIESGNTIVLLSNNDFRMVDTLRKKIERILANTPVNHDLEIIQTTMKHGYAFGKQLYDLKKAENPGYRLNQELLYESIRYFNSIGKQQLSAILEQMATHS